VGSRGSEDATWHLGTVCHKGWIASAISANDIKYTKPTKVTTMQFINFDASKTAWREFLIKQSEEHPDFFKIPQSFQAQEYFKTVLELIAKRSMSFESVMGLWPFIDSVKNENVRNQMWTWIEKYTPIRHQFSKDVSRQIIVVRDYRVKCSLIDGKTNPYYTLKPQPRKHFQGKGKKPLPSIENDLATDVLAPAVSELDFQKKLAKLSLNKFLNDRSIENRNALIAAVQSIPLGSSEKKGSPFLQGGAMGLKR
jgi:hypothetical protein